ncbi:major facilitator superfamily domain-containing protein [Daldinia caldariorum]|uniref:major facilitator superfamily domain-containing protein n=1 Tax=Daldinia caldariorum TaxID=326644 RepID=UPI0020072D2E|nr:major facilitator superfamily domain-containing protein [Daldinia caldariorum]KAI1464434.1 major facilitator superfamily domain-containing protein [Daldinia caldariorum]
MKPPTHDVSFSAPEHIDDQPTNTESPLTSQSRGWRFWVVLIALGITSLSAAVESTVTSTALPRIAGALDAGELYVWFVNAYTLTSTAFLPLFGQIADIFGRRWLTIGIVAVFALGSGISGGATSATMLIAGRAVQGVGGGGIILMIEMIVCDLVSLRDRGRFTAVIMGLFGIVSILLPLILGFAGLGLFVLYESSRWCAEPMTPPRLFQNRTSATAFYLTFIHSLLSFWSGVLLLPTAVVIIPGGIIGGFVIDAALYVCLQLVTGLGSGLVLGALLPAVQAALTEKDTASSTATWTFIRTFGTIWGVSVPAAIFNSRSNDLSNRIEDPSARALVANGQAYSHATSAVLLSLETYTRDQVISVFTDSLKLVWIVAVVIAGVSFFAIFVEREIGLRDDLNTSYGLTEKTDELQG